MALTEIDIELATIFYPMLVELARDNAIDTYQNLLIRARLRHPGNARLERAIPLSVGRRLEVIRLFTRPRGYPDLSALIVNESKGIPGGGFDGDFEADRAKIAAFDWSDVEADFSIEVASFRKALAKPTKRDRDTAKQIMWDYIKMHGKGFEKTVDRCRDELLTLLMQGMEVEDAFEIAAAPYRKAA